MKKIITGVLLLLACVCYGQNITGVAAVHVGDVQSYVFSDGNSYAGYHWVTTLGSISGSNNTGSSYTVTIAWNSQGTGTLIFTDQSNVTKGTITIVVSAAVTPSAQNSIVETTVMIPSVTTSTAVDPLPIGSKLQTTKYFDGLGRGIQTVNKQASPLRRDVVQPVVYDALGREPITYLPYAANEANGLFKSDPTGTSSTYASSAQYAFYNNPNDKVADDFPAATKVYEASPLNRVLKQGAPGSTWQPASGDAYGTTDKTIKIRQESNVANEIILFTYNDFDGLVTGSGTALQYYGAGQLLLKKTLDERNFEALEYTDKRGHVVCKKVLYKNDDTTQLPLYVTTYYIYNSIGNLVLVLPPEAVRAFIKQNTY